MLLGILAVTKIESSALTIMQVKNTGHPLIQQIKTNLLSQRMIVHITLYSSHKEKYWQQPSSVICFSLSRIFRQSTTASRFADKPSAYQIQRNPSVSQYDLIDSLLPTARCIRETEGFCVFAQPSAVYPSRSNIGGADAVTNPLFPCRTSLPV